MMRHLDLFSGIGGFSLAADWVWGEEHEIVAFCEIDKFCQKVLKKHWPNVEIVEDIRIFDGKGFKGTVDILTGGFPCQDISSNGKQEGIDGKRSGLWRVLCNIISEVRPRYAIMENVSNLLIGDRGNWFARVLGDLATIGYDAQWHIISAKSIGFNHQRDRVFILAYPSSIRWDAAKFYNSISFEHKKLSIEYSSSGNQEIRRLSQTDICRENDGIPDWMDRLKSLGNAIMPQAAMVIMQAIKEVENV
jgi:DNA (cytosine-5)-methyltransferase 1